MEGPLRAASGFAALFPVQQGWLLVFLRIGKDSVTSEYGSGYINLLEYKRILKQKEAAKSNSIPISIIDVNMRASTPPHSSWGSAFGTAGAWDTCLACQVLVQVGTALLPIQLPAALQPGRRQVFPVVESCYPRGKPRLNSGLLA